MAELVATGKSDIPIEDCRVDRFGSAYEAP